MIARLLIALALVGCGSSSARPVSEDGAVPSAGPPVADAGATEAPARVLATTGTVERRTAGGWVPLRPGDQLSLHDSIRTGDDGGADIELSRTLTVTLAERSEITVLDLSRSVAGLVLDQGRLTAASTAGTRIRIETRDSGATAESDGGRFSVLHREGQVAVAVEEGAVALSARGGRVDVPAGSQAVVAPGGQPGAPQPIPPSLFLKVRRLQGSRVSGETVPGSVISINGVVTTTDADGRFDEPVEVGAGDGVIIVQVEDVQGRRQQRVLRKTVDKKPPALDTSVEWQ